MAIKRSKKKTDLKSKGKQRFTDKYNLILTLKKRHFKRAIALVFLYFFALSLFWVLALRFINPPITYLMISRGIERKAEGKSFMEERNWLNYEQLSDNLKKAAITGEDARFLLHYGFDTKAIQEAYRKNQHAQTIRGGSTISQQTAKNVFLWPGRSWVRKGLEAYFTALIELLWGKKRILEVYLNVIEMGDGIYGVDAAAKAYFNKKGTAMTKREAALIVAVLPNPRRWSPSKPTPYINRKTATIMRYMGYSKIP